jgi:uncharacterized repeat protein (TIGR01451 family)
MTIAKRLWRGSLALVAVSTLGALQAAYAAGTPANTQITNTATLTYSVGGVPQNPISDDVSFRVDRVVDVDVEGDSTTTTVPGGTAGARFTVTNTGNGADSFNLGGTNESVGDDFDVPSFTFYLDDTVNGTQGSYDAEDDQIVGPLTLAPDVITTVFIVSTVPLNRVNGDDAIVRLTATSTSTASGAGAPDDPTTVQVVIDSPSDDDTSTYVVETATLSVVKSSEVIEDPVNGVSANAKAIPGAIVKYTITIQNSGSAEATNLSVTDAISSELAYVPGTLQLNGSATGTVTGSNVSVPITSLAVGATATVTFQVEIQ